MSLFQCMAGIKCSGEWSTPHHSPGSGKEWSGRGRSGLCEAVSEQARGGRKPSEVTQPEHSAPLSQPARWSALRKPATVRASDEHRLAGCFDARGRGDWAGGDEEKQYAAAMRETRFKNKCWLLNEGSTCWGNKTFGPLRVPVMSCPT